MARVSCPLITAGYHSVSFSILANLSRWQALCTRKSPLEKLWIQHWYCSPHGIRCHRCFNLVRDAVCGKWPYPWRRPSSCSPLLGSSKHQRDTLQHVVKPPFDSGTGRTPSESSTGAVPLLGSGGTDVSTQSGMPDAGTGLTLRDVQVVVNSTLKKELSPGSALFTSLQEMLRMLTAAIPVLKTVQNLITSHSYLGVWQSPASPRWRALISLQELMRMRIGACHVQETVLNFGASHSSQGVRESAPNCLWVAHWSHPFSI